MISPTVLHTRYTGWWQEIRLYSKIVSVPHFLECGSRRNHCTIQHLIFIVLFIIGKFLLCSPKFIVGSTEAPSKAFLLVFLFSDWLKSNHLKSRIDCGFWTFFGPYLWRCDRNNTSGKLHNKFWPEKMFRKPSSELLRWFLMRGTNN